jgi:predicted RNA binding protein YcfA (HicA-like mRNA interferase family)
MTGKKAVRLLRKEGWVLVRVEGSHHILEKNNFIVSVPVHGNRDLKKGTEHSIFKAAEAAK